MLIDSAHVVASCFDKRNILRPCNFAIVAEGPLLGKYLSRFDRMLITEAFVDEASLEPRFPLVVLTFS